ncbi:hypothetical protein [Sphingomonas jatrophae]|uniref:Uncharacterized protein n=1 Tax=Sphingomonas jatrophae TaxID=1166337 RepID=A0A1I6JXT5_9SPHN|nr:hypothetical protein [Sphingomonas jatrophae]SFR83789.1 hypothetical protein SAMN05192580_1054 [Sphingomonas jatrophae]
MPALAQPTLSTSEWNAVAIALKDAQRCGCTAEAIGEEAGPVRRLATFLTGRRRPNPLADPRLEAVRQFVCTSYRRRAPATEIAPALAEHGFNRAQIDALGLLAR